MIFSPERSTEIVHWGEGRRKETRNVVSTDTEHLLRSCLWVLWTVGAVHKLVEFSPFCSPLYFPLEQGLCPAFRDCLNKLRALSYCSLNFSTEGSDLPAGVSRRGPGPPERILPQAHSGRSGDASQGRRREVPSQTTQLGSERLVLGEPSEHWLSPSIGCALGVVFAVG